MKDDDLNLFRQSVSVDKQIKFDGIKPARGKAVIKPNDASTQELQIIDDMFSEDFEAASLETGDELHFFQPGVSKADFRKLRKGLIKIQRELDLHGMTVTMARENLANFLFQCKFEDIRCIRIIHGKGRGSKNGQPVIKNKVNNWLRQRNEVLAFCSARQNDGGTGAVYVLLRKA